MGQLRGSVCIEVRRQVEAGVGVASGRSEVGIRMWDVGDQRGAGQDQRAVVGGGRSKVAVEMCNVGRRQVGVRKSMIPARGPQTK